MADIDCRHFENLVKEFIIQGGSPKKLASKCNVDENSIYNWAEGKACPLPAIVEDVVSKIKKLRQTETLTLEDILDDFSGLEPEELSIAYNEAFEDSIVYVGDGFWERIVK